MQAERLLRLYPPAWRARYGDEFLALAGGGPLRARQAIDIISGAIDAWLTADVRRATRVHATMIGGSARLESLTCTSRATVTARDAAIGATVMIGASMLFALVGLAARTRGWDTGAEVLLSLSFPAALTLSSPFWLMPAATRRAQVAVVGVTPAILGVIGGATAVLAG
jgi:hypothetical protein